MKYCSKCGKELFDEAVVCPGCGCAAEPKVNPNGFNGAVTANTVQSDYDDAIKSAMVLDIVSVILIIVGIIIFLFVSMIVASVIFLAAELVVLIPNTKVRKLYKQNNLSITDKKEYKASEKAFLKDLKSKHTDFKLSMVVAIIALVGLIVSVFFW